MTETVNPGIISKFFSVSTIPLFFVYFFLSFILFSLSESKKKSPDPNDDVEMVPLNPKPGYLFFYFLSLF